MGDRPRLPDVLFPAPRPELGGVAPREALFRAAESVGSQQSMRFVPQGAPVRIILGEARVGALVLNALVHGNWFVMQLLWCWARGGAEGLQSITWNDAALPAGVELRHYTGDAGNTLDPWIAAAFAAAGKIYPDTLPNWCWTALRVPVGLIASDGLPQLAAVVRGIKAYDARSGLTVWTDNPSVLTAAWLADPDWGRDIAVDQGSVGAAADANDDLVGAQKRRRLGLAIETDVPVEDLLEALRTYAGCWVTPGPDGARLVADRPVASMPAIGDGSAIKIRTVKEIAKRGRNTAPTVIRVWYTNRSVVPWRRDYAEWQHPGLSTGAVPYRDSDVHLPGIPDYSQALREATERGRKLTLSDLTVKFGTFDEGLAIEPGDVRTLTCLGGIVAKPVRVLSRSGGLGDWDFVAAEYDPAAYSDATGTAPSYADTPLPSPGKPTAPTGLALTEELFPTQGDKTSSRIKATWSAPANFPWVDHYRVNVRAAGEVVWPATVRPGDVFRSGSLAELVAYQVDVHTVSASGAVSPPASATLTAQGKLLPPSDIATMSGFESAGEVFLTIGASSDIDLKGIEVRYGLPGVAWGAAKFVDFKPAASGVGAVVRSNIIPEGTFDFLACGRDSGGRYSTNPKRITITVTKDDRAFLVDQHLFDEAPTLTLMSAARLLRGGPTHWITDAGDDMNYGHADPDPATGDYADLADQPFSAPRSGGTASWQSAAWDVGVVVSGNWLVSTETQVHSGTVSVILMLSEDGASYTDHAGASHKATARFAKVRLEGDGVFQLDAPPTLRIDAVPRTETGTVTTSASAPVTVTLDGKYAFVKSIKLTLVGQPPGSALYDNVAIAPDGTTTFEIERFDSSDVRLGGVAVAWEANAV